MRRTMMLALAVMLLAAAGAIAATKKPSPKPKKGAAGEPGALKTSLENLVAAEQSFARMAQDKGIRAAFLANLSPDCVMFNPLPVNGYELYQDRPASAAKLAWGPAYAEVAASGDFGFTSGPWEYTPPVGQPNAEVSYGEFFSVWRRHGKDWKVVLDFGVSHSRPPLTPGGTPVTPGPLHSMMELPEDTLTADLMRTLDRSFSNMARALNPSRAMVAWAARDLRFLKEGDDPRTGDDARNALSGAPANAVWRTIDGAVARSGDLGYSYGVREDSTGAGAPPDTTVYVHVWRYGSDKQWKLAAVVNKPLRRE